MDKITEERMVAALGAKIERIVDQLPLELVEQARNLTETALHREVAMRSVDHIMRVLSLLSAALERCHLCRGAEALCAHCVAAGMEVLEIAQEAMVLATMTRAATRPGGRIAAQREAEAERNAKERS